MPQLQVVDTTPNKPEPTAVENLFSRLSAHYKEKSEGDEIARLVQEHQDNQNDENSLQNFYSNIQKSPKISPSKKIEAIKTFNEGQKAISERQKSINSGLKKGLQSQQDKQEEKQFLINDGYPEVEADIYVNSPPGVKQSLERNHRMEKARGLRGQPKQENTQNLNAVDANIESDLQQAEPEQIEKEIPWNDLKPPENMIPSEKIKWENNNEKTNIKELKEVEKKKKSYRDNGILIKSMTKTNESKKLPSGLGKMVVIDPETGDIRPIAQLAEKINPETELYVKNLKQFLKGAKDFFGARVTNFDVSSFMQQLPSLLNSEQGRRLILKQMELVNDLEAVHANELDEGLKHYGRKANYLDISRTVDERVAAKQSVLLNKIDNVVDATSQLEKMSKNPDKFRGAVLMQTDKGEWKAVKKDLIQKYEDKGWMVY